MAKKKRRLYRETEVEIVLLERIDLLTGSGEEDNDGEYLADWEE